MTQWLFLIVVWVSGTFVGAISIAAVSRLKAAVADDVLSSLIEIRSWFEIRNDGLVVWYRTDIPTVFSRDTIDRADIAIFNATEQPCSKKSH